MSAICVSQAAMCVSGCDVDRGCDVERGCDVGIARLCFASVSCDVGIARLCFASVSCDVGIARLCFACLSMSLLCICLLNRQMKQHFLICPLISLFLLSLFSLPRPCVPGLCM